MIKKKINKVNLINYYFHKRNNFRRIRRLDAILKYKLVCSSIHLFWVPRVFQQL